MAINYIPNDPRAGTAAPGLRSQEKRPNRPAARSGFTTPPAPAEGNFDPGTAPFLFWQCREAALAALDAFEAAAGPHKKWQGNRAKLALFPDKGLTLNAFYDRQSFSFFHATDGTTTFFSGASTDVVAHEVGHGLLDSIRPELFTANNFEAAAFHEAFGDCMAILTALEDDATRTALLAVTTTLRKKNFVEGTAEDLSEGIRRIAGAGHNAAAPRRALNKFQYQLPETLPDNGGPGALINEVHSFGMIFSGCFWDVLSNIFAAGPATSAGLLAAARSAGKILIAGAGGAVITPRFLQSVGRAMVLADESLNAAANRDHIRNAFMGHGILLGTNTMIAPAMALAGPAPAKATVSKATRQDIADRLAAPAGARMSVAAVNLFGTPAVEVTHEREVPLGALDERLKGVVGMALEPVMVGNSGGRAAVMGMMPNAIDSLRDVQEFVKTLLKHGRIEFEAPPAQGIVADTQPAQQPATHTVKTVGGKKVLTRIRFLCGCGGSHR